MCLATSEWVAIKVISPKSFGTGFVEMRVSMAREVSIMSNLSHPNICELKDAFHHEHDGSLSECFLSLWLMTRLSGGIDLVMELALGGDLCTHMSDGLILIEDEAKFMIWQICDALAVS